MTSRSANKIKQRREKLKENQTPVVVPKPRLVWFWVLAALVVFTIGLLSYLAYTGKFTNELIITIVVGVIVFVLLVIWYLPKFYVRSLPNEIGKGFDIEKEKLKLEDDTRKTFAQIVGGVVLLGGLIFTYNTFRLQQEGQFTDRFTKAVTQLGDDKLEIRLGGMYALERIAKDSPKDHWTVIEILSAYIREKTKKRGESANNNDSNKTANDEVEEAEGNAKVKIDIQTALTIIGRRKFEQDLKTDTINLNRTNLSRADLIETNLSRANLSRAILSGVYLIEANLSGAYLTEANLSGAILQEADLSGAYLWRTDLSGADLSLVKNLTFEQLSIAIINENTRLPDNLENRKSELIETSKRNLEERKKLLNETNKK